jgi:predicted helicase
MDTRVADTYVKDSTARLLNKLSDPYVKAVRFATDKIKDNGEGIVAFVTNNSFLDHIAFDGMRKHLADDFDEVYVLDLGGNVRKNPKLSGTTHNVFGIQVGVSINLLVRRRRDTNTPRGKKIYYARVGEDWRKEDKYKFLDEARQRSGVEWQELQPDAKHTWLTEGMRDDFEAFLPLGSKEAKASKSVDVRSIFKIFSGGMKTNRDVWVHNYQRSILEDNVKRTIENYNAHVYRLQAAPSINVNIDEFVDNDESKISWSRSLKEHLRRKRLVAYAPDEISTSLYRPFCKQNLYFNNLLSDYPGLLSRIFPKGIGENLAICVPSIGGRTDHWCLCTDTLPAYALTSVDVSQCFPFYTYDAAGANRRENITDWALTQFRAQYNSKSISKPDIFHYVYALLHHATYRTTYAANLKRELPRIPFVSTLEDFRVFVKAGQHLVDIHVNYESQPEYKLEHVENKDAALDWHVKRMKLSKDKTSIVYNDFLTLEGIPPEAFEYRLGNRSALEWIIDQYQVSTDKRSGITNDPNRADEPDYIVKLIGKITTVSVETVKIVHSLPALRTID